MLVVIACVLSFQWILKSFDQLFGSEQSEDLTGMRQGLPLIDIVSAGSAGRSETRFTEGMKAVFPNVATAPGAM